MMRSLGYAVLEGATSMRRDWRTAAFALAVIAAAVFVTAALLIASSIADRVVASLTGGPDVSVFLALEAGPEVRTSIQRAVRQEPAVEAVRFVAAEEAARRFTAAYPDLAPLLAQGFALPASLDVTLKREGLDPARVEALERAVRALPGVDQVRYDRDLAARAAALARGVRGAGLAMAGLLALAAALAIFSVIRLAYVARRDEIEILLLVGAPPVAIRGPFIVEGALQAALGALIGLASLGIAVAVVAPRLEAAIRGTVGADVTIGVAGSTAALVLAASTLVGALSAWLAWRSSSRAFTT